LRAICLRDQRRGERVYGTVALAPDEVDARGDVAPLIRTAELQRAPETPMQLEVVVRLKKLVRELGEADGALEARLRDLARDHAIDGEVLADLREELDGR